MAVEFFTKAPLVPLVTPEEIIILMCYRENLKILSGKASAGANKYLFDAEIKRVDQFISKHFINNK